MSSWVEQARLKVSEGWRGIIIAFLVLLFFSYNFIWAVVEPINISDQLLVNTKDALYISRIWLHIIHSSVFAFFLTLYLYLKLKRYLEKLSLHVGDTNIQTCWTKSEGSTKIVELRDGFLGNIVNISGTNHHAIDYQLRPVSHNAKRIEYLARPENNFVLYIKVKLKSKNENTTVLKWIALVLNSVSPTPLGSGENEWSYPVTPHHLSGKWMRYSINIKEAVQETYGTQGWNYFSLYSLRIRGSSDIESISIF